MVQGLEDSGVILVPFVKQYIRLSHSIMSLKRLGDLRISPKPRQALIKLGGQGIPNLFRR